MRYFICLCLFISISLMGCAIDAPNEVKVIYPSEDILEKGPGPKPPCRCGEVGRPHCKGKPKNCPPT